MLTCSAVKAVWKRGARVGSASLLSPEKGKAGMHLAKNPHMGRAPCVWKAQAPWLQMAGSDKHGGGLFIVALHCSAAPRSRSRRQTL